MFSIQCAGVQWRGEGVFDLGRGVVLTALATAKKMSIPAFVQVLGVSGVYFVGMSVVQLNEVLNCLIAAVTLLFCLLKFIVWLCRVSDKFPKDGDEE